VRPNALGGSGSVLSESWRDAPAGGWMPRPPLEASTFRRPGPWRSDSKPRTSMGHQPPHRSPSAEAHRRAVTERRSGCVVATGMGGATNFLTAGACFVSSQVKFADSRRSARSAVYAYAYGRLSPPVAAGLVAARGGLVMGLSGAPMRASWDIGRSPRLAGITPPALMRRVGTLPMPIRAGTAPALLARRCW